ILDLIIASGAAAEKLIGDDVKIRRFLGRILVARVEPPPERFITVSERRDGSVQSDCFGVKLESAPESIELIGVDLAGGEWERDGEREIPAHAVCVSNVLLIGHRVKCEAHDRPPRVYVSLKHLTCAWLGIGKVEEKLIEITSRVEPVLTSQPLHFLSQAVVQE